MTTVNVFEEIHYKPGAKVWFKTIAWGEDNTSEEPAIVHYHFDEKVMIVKVQKIKNEYRWGQLRIDEKNIRPRVEDNPTDQIARNALTLLKNQKSIFKRNEQEQRTVLDAEHIEREKLREQNRARLQPTPSRARGRL